MIDNVKNFVQYYDGIRQRTLKYVRSIPAENIAWSPKEGEFSFGEIVRHIVAIEQMITGLVVEGVVRYQGHNLDAGMTCGDLVRELETEHQTAMRLLELLGDGCLASRRKAIDGTYVKVWRLLMTMVEHEIHHRSQLAVYLTLLEIEAPQLYDLGVDDVIAAAIN